MIGVHFFKFNSRYIARIIMHNPQYKKKQSIRLLSCYTGSTTNGFAQNLANKLNVVVYAPTNIVWAYPGGKIVVAPRQTNNPDYPDLSKKGKFVAFYPGGNKKR